MYCSWCKSCFPLFHLQIFAAWYPDSPPHAAGVSGLHDHALRHVLQHLDLHRGRRGLGPRIFHLISFRGSHLMVWTVQTEDSVLLFFFLLSLPHKLKGSPALDTKWETRWLTSFYVLLCCSVVSTVSIIEGFNSAGAQRGTTTEEWAAQPLLLDKTLDCWHFLSLLSFCLQCLASGLGTNGFQLHLNWHYLFLVLHSLCNNINVTSVVK